MQQESQRAGRDSFVLTSDCMQLTCPAIECVGHTKPSQQQYEELGHHLTLRNGACTQHRKRCYPCSC